MRIISLVSRSLAPLFTATLALFLSMLTLAGCSQNAHVSSSIELMNAERRALEDQLYELEYEYESAVEEIEYLQEQNEKLRSKGGRLGSRSASGGPTLDDDYDVPRVLLPEIDEGDLTVPQVELPDMEFPQGDGAELLPPAQIPVSSIRTRISPSDPRATQLEIHPRMTRGIDLDQAPGDDGLEILIQPVNDRGELVALPGAVTVVALDYALRGQGQQARIARWDLTAEQVGRFLDDTPKGRGIRLQLLWPQTPPRHHRLRLDVRYETLDGRYLEARRDVTVRTPTSTLSQRWTPRSAVGGGSLQADLSPTSNPPTSEDPPAQLEPSPPRPVLARPEWTPYR